MKIKKEIEFETLHSNKHRIYLLCGIVCIVVLMVTLIVTTSKAKYRTTESIPLIQGTINFSPSDLNLMAVYLNKNGDTISSDKVPHVGYTLNTEQSICEVNNEKDEAIEIVYENGYLYVNKLSYKGTKCTAYFDLIPDSENPVINAINSSGDDTSINITIDATDNIGIYYYYYKLDNEEEVRTEENSYTFEGLEKNSVHTITVRVEDAAGNISETKSKEVTVGLKGGSFILASENAPTSHTTDWTGKESYYYTGNPNNWVSFAGFYWRIIRINGDETIRMIYSGSDATGPATSGTDTQIGTSAFNSSYNNNMYVGYMYQSGQLHGLQRSSTIKGVLDNWYTNNIVNKGYGKYVDGNAGFCGDRRVTSGTGTGTDSTTYQSFTRISNSSPSLSCEDADIYTTMDSSTGNKALTQPIGLISADEAMIGGIPWSVHNTNSYLYTEQNYWTMSPDRFNSTGIYQSGDANVFYVIWWGSFYSGDDANNTHGVRPVINLRSDVQITGTGSQTDPFVVVKAS